MLRSTGRRGSYRPRSTAPTPHFADTGLVPVFIGFSDRASREIAKAAKGRWDPDQKLWLIQYRRVKGIELEKHLILNAFAVETTTGSSGWEAPLEPGNQQRHPLLGQRVIADINS